MKPGSRSAACLALGLLAGCAEVGRQEGPSSPESLVSDEALPPIIMERQESQPLKYLANRDLKPIPTRPLNVRSRCSHRDDVGTQTNLKLLVKNAKVRTFVASISMPKYGTCRFDLRNFKQTATLPQALLAAKDGSDCTVRLWEQENKVTVAFNSCPDFCDGDAFSYLWPIMVEAKTGRCF